jgi:cold shock CspA family protein
MTAGKVTKLVTSYGSTWGRITPDREAGQLFFNPKSLVDAAVYPELKLGQDVDFDEEPDRANGTHAVRVRIRSTEALKN